MLTRPGKKSPHIKLTIEVDRESEGRWAPLSLPVLTDLGGEMRQHLWHACHLIPRIQTVQYWTIIRAVRSAAPFVPSTRSVCNSCIVTKFCHESSYIWTRITASQSFPSTTSSPEGFVFLIEGPSSSVLRDRGSENKVRISRTARAGVSVSS